MHADLVSLQLFCVKIILIYDLTAKLVKQAMGKLQGMTEHSFNNVYNWQHFTLLSGQFVPYHLMQFQKFQA